MASVGLAVSALLLLGTVFIIASAQGENVHHRPMSDDEYWRDMPDSEYPVPRPEPENDCASLFRRYMHIPDICNEVRTVLHKNKETGEVLRVAVIPAGSGCEVDAFLLLCNNNY